jgi:purine-nucleoside phosphorylase
MPGARSPEGYGAGLRQSVREVPMSLYESLQRAAQALAVRTGAAHHDAAVVLGSGLGDYATSREGAVAVPYADIPGFPLPGAAAHAGVAVSSEVGGVRVLLLSGRVHYYEGRGMDEVTFAVRTAISAGCRTVVLTNAAGACGDGLERGDLVLIRDHLNLAGVSPLRGPNDERLGPRWPDMTDVYSPKLRNVVRVVAAELGVVLREGVYAWFAGPMYETPAEVEMARRLGADLVGMSTVPEAVAARHMGAEVLGISLATNLAAGISGAPITPDEVLTTAAEAGATLARLLDAVLPRL